MSPLRNLPALAAVACAFLMSFLVVSHLANDVLSSVELFPPEPQQREYQEEICRLLEQLSEAERRHAPAVELERIREEHNEVARRYLEFLRMSDR